jgi:uncharacterized membrane protein (UPF0182 family)
MRVPPTIEPRRRTLGLRAWLIGAVVLIIILLASLRGLAGFYTNYLWFQEVGFSATWRGLIAAKLVPTLVFTAFFFVLMFVNLVIADRLAPRTRAMGPEDEMVERYRSYVAPYSGRLRVVISAFFAFVVGSGVSSKWADWILFRNHVDFGQKDPQFHRDIGFYVFQLPFLRFVSQWLFVSFVLVLLIVAVFHYINGGIRLQTPFQRVTPQVKAHLSVILALMAFTKTAQYYLARFELVFSKRGTVDGATYTDVKAQLPALNFLMIISVAAAVLFIVNIWRRGWVLPVIAVGLWGFISIVVGTIYPAYIQRFDVKPNEFTKEQPYIERNLAATRFAFGIDNVISQSYSYKENLDAAVVKANQPTLDNVRLWDPAQLQPNLAQNQKFRPYFTFSDLDLDRYPVGVEKLQVEIAIRELNSAQLPSSTWVNQHLAYTHGYGAVAAAGNAVRADQTPDYLLSNIPPTGDPNLEVTQPNVYFGEDLSGFTVVDSKQRENQPTGSQHDTTIRYKGTGGVVTSSFLRKAALALSFGSWDLFISKQVGTHSRVMFRRDVRDRVEKAAPFLKFDADPYAVIIGGKLQWVLDAYTTTNRYPYSQSLHPRGVSGSSGLDSTFNYVRNSVKVTVDAYNGTITYYVIDEKDPIIRAYEKAFPRMFTSGSKVPPELREHFRYPEDLFKTQTEQYQRYHLKGASEFYRAGNLWSVAPAPNSSEGTDSTSATNAPAGNNGGRSTELTTSGEQINPLYLMMQLPGRLGREAKQEFVLQRTFVPAANPNVLTAFIVARSDGKNYGQLVIYDTPDNQDIPSPSKAASNIDSNTDISKQLSLLDQRGSQVIRGDVQLIPIGDSLLYVRPIYVQATTGATFPRFKYVAVTYGEHSVLSDSMTNAIAALGLGTGEEPPTPVEPTQPETGTVAELLADAQKQFDAASAALKNEDLAAYAKAIDAAQAKVAAASKALEEVAGSTTTSVPGATTTTRPSTTTTTTTTPPA